MKLTIDRAALLSVATQAASVADPRSSMPILGNVLLRTLASAGGAHLEACATDLYVGTRARAACDVTEPGSLLVAAKPLKELASKLPDGPVSLALEGSALVVKAGRSRYRLPTMPADDFPPLPEAKGETATVDGELLASVLDATSCAMSTDESRPHLAALLLEVCADVVRCVSTDGHRLHLVERKVEGAELPSMLVPRNAVALLRRLCTQPLTLATDGRNLFATAGDVSLSVKLAEEQFPPYGKVIPKKHAHEVHVSRDAFAESLKRIAFLAANDGVRLTFGEGVVELATENPDVGEGVDEVDCDATGGPTIGCNSRYLLEALKGADETATLRLSGELDPITITGDGFTAVVMPMRT